MLLYHSLWSSDLLRVKVVSIKSLCIWKCFFKDVDQSRGIINVIINWGIVMLVISVGRKLLGLPMF